jgi:hypothetical protein
MLMRAADPVLAAALAKCTSILWNTATSGSVASVPDAKNAASPATAAGAAQPTGAAGGRLSFDGTDFLTVPCTAARTGSPRWAFAGWFKPNTVTGAHTLLSARTEAGSSASRMGIYQSATGLLWDIYASAFSVRRGTFANIFALDTDVFITCEYDGTQTNGDTQTQDNMRATLTKNGVAVTGVFTNDTGTPNAVPTTLVQPTGNFLIGSATTGPASVFSGLAGPAFLIAQPATSLSGGGIWTPAERIAIMRWLRPTV